MSKTSSTGGSAAGKIVTWLLAVALVLGVTFAVVYFLPREQPQSQGLSVEYAGVQYNGGEGESLVLAPSGEPVSFTVQHSDAGYTVTVTANSANNFSFIFENEYYYFYGADAALNDYTALFSVKQTEEGFTLTVPEMTAEEIIEAKFGGDISPVEAMDAELPYFILTVKCGEEAISIPFAVYYRITIDPPAIIF